MWIIILGVIASGIGVTLKSLKAQGETTIFGDDFEAYPVNTFPSEGGWVLRYNGQGSQYQKVVDTVSVSGSKSLHLLGRPNWSACAMKSFAPNSDILGYEV